MAQAGISATRAWADPIGRTARESGAASVATMSLDEVQWGGHVGAWPRPPNHRGFPIAGSDANLPRLASRTGDGRRLVVSASAASCLVTLFHSRWALAAAPGAARCPRAAPAPDRASRERLWPRACPRPR